VKENRMKVLGVRLTEAQVMQLRERAEVKHITLSTLGRVLFEMFLRGEVKV
jgi:hypothetical protein